MASAFRRLTLEGIRQMRQFRKADADDLKRWRRVRGNTQRSAYLKAIQAKDWDRLAEQARKEILARLDDLRQMARRRERILALQQLEERRSALLLASKDVRAQRMRERWPAIQANLGAELRGRGLSAERVAKTLKALRARKLSRASDAGLGRSLRQVDGFAHAHLSALAAATFALAVARFNKLVDDGAVTDGSADRFCDDTQRRLRAAERTVWEALRKNDSIAAWAAATHLAEYATTTVLGDAVRHAAARALTRTGSAAARERNGRLALRVGDTIRDLLCASALGRYLSWLAAGNPSTELIAWVRAARQLKFPSAVKRPPAVSIATLTRGRGASGKQMTVEGILGSVSIVHKGRKAIASASILDATGRSVTVAMPYIKFDSAGLVPGSYVRIAGSWARRSREVEGPALLIDRLNLTTLARKSWSDWATAELRPLFQSVPHGLAAGWSWQPGIDGAGNPLRYGVWSARKGVE